MQKKSSVIEPIVYILGPEKQNNDLLAYFLEKETGLICDSSSNLTQIQLNLDKWKSPRIVLRDSQAIDLTNPWFGLGIGSKSNKPNCLLVLFKVPPDKAIEKKIAERGVRGIFYENDPLDRFKKGIPAILNGELWFSRSVMVKPFLELSAQPHETQVPLSRREKEVLILIASGLTNDEISDDLHISLHTVKNHASTIYKKIDVNNRLQAAMWAAMYI